MVKNNISITVVLKDYCEHCGGYVGGFEYEKNIYL